ncbi:MAG: DNA polymerase III subunit gamma/tau [Acidiferrobacterales bacterium]
MSYQVLARKYRPRTFSEVVGQEHVVRALVHALDNDRVHHAFLFTGTRGVGKTTIARVLAKSLNCEQGVGSAPCGSCRACMELDEGRFIDLIEVDAASRTKVDDTRELLENVQYASMHGRYKVYLIDEVHMLSGHSFNALLKTLEEPPPHVKFLLATTDPQKLPMTILSRCLQFNLKRLLPDVMRSQLKRILDAEGVPYDEGALGLLARSADGSMRDALSLLDQAIAFGSGKVLDLDVRDMLGTIDQQAVEQILQALSVGDAKALLDVVAGVSEQSTDYDSVLSELLLKLHQISLVQVDLALADAQDGEQDRLLAHADAMTQEDVQLYYQIGMIGRRDLSLAPDPRTGLEMILLRMLVFRPIESAGMQTVAQQATPPPAPKHAAEAKPQAKPSRENWNEIVDQLSVSGFAGELARNTTLDSYTDGEIVLVLDKKFSQLHNQEREAALKTALQAYCGESMTLTVRVGEPERETPAQQRLRLQDTRQRAAAEAINNDPNVKALKERFNATVNPDSIRPKA